MFEKTMFALQKIEDEMTIKNDYSNEIETLDTIKSNTYVMRTEGLIEPWQFSRILKKISDIKNWIMEETTK